jgi:hypothetical protein
MDKHQMIDLLSMVAAFDKRKVGQTEVEAWFMAVGKLNLDDARQAVAEHFATSTDYLMPVHVAQGVKRIRADRLDRAPAMPPPVEIVDNSRDVLGWLHRQIRDIADGKFVGNILGPPAGQRRPGPPPEEFGDAREAMAPDDDVRRLALTVACPHCGAPAGKGCTLSGTTDPLTSKPAHDARVERVTPGQAAAPHTPKDQT